MFGRKPSVRSVSINLVIETEDHEPDSIVPELVVDGVRFEAFDNGPLNLWELEKSIKESGTYFIWTCWCGYPGCAGLFKGVKVKRSGDVVMWKDLDRRRRFSFRQEELLRALASADQDGEAMCVERPDLEAAPDINLSRFREPVE